MLRSLLVLLLLAHYLLVVGAGLVERPARAIDRPFAYVHGADCQLRNSLRIGCFDDCNGVQYTVKKHGERLPLQQLLTSLKGLDLHHLPSTALVPGRRLFHRRESRPVAVTVGVPNGYGERVDLPPRRG